MKIEVLELNSKPIHILYLDSQNENSKIQINNLKEIISLGNELVCLEGVDFSTYDQWQSHTYKLLQGIDSEKYLVRNIVGVDIALKKEDLTIIFDEIWIKRNIFMTFINEKYLPFSLAQKMNGFGSDWKKAFKLLNGFNWNLQFLISERSYFSSPFESVINEIINILGI